MNVVIYARFSSSKQNEMSIEAQLLEAEEFCKRNDYTIVGKYIDRGISAKTDRRPNFQKMIADSNKKLFSGIVVYQLDRFSRNRYDSAIYKSKLKKNGVRVLSVRENISDDASGIMVEGLLESMAEYFSVELGQKVSRNMRLNAQKGYFNGGPLPLGFKLISERVGNKDKKKIAIDEETSPIIKEIFEMRANDRSILEIVDYLNSKGYKTQQGKEFKKNSLDKILKNKRYIGTNIYGDEEFPNSIPAIIDKDVFNKVQAIIEKHKYAPATTKAKEEYILTTKLYCGKCKELMTGTCGTSRTGAIYYYYTCNGVKKKICNRKNIQKHYIEDIVIKKCKSLLTNENIDKISKKVYDICQKENSQNSFIKALEKRVKELNRSVENLLKAMEKGQNIDLINDRLTQNRFELENSKEQLENEKKKLVNLTKEQIKFFLTQLKNEKTDNIKYRKTLINVFVNRIYLYDDKLTIIFNVGKTPLTVDVSLLKEINTNIKNAPSLFLNDLGTPYKYVFLTDLKRRNRKWSSRPFSRHGSTSPPRNTNKNLRKK